MNIEFMSMIDQELDAAKAKHPKFCEKFLYSTHAEIYESLFFARERNDADNEAEVILAEEVAEALEAYHKHDLDHCLQELAQCGAVILRMMEFVKNEKEAK